MNKRIKNKMDKAKRKEIHALLDAVLDINGMHPRTMRETGNLPTVFIRFAGHTGIFYLDVYSYGWDPDDRPDFESKAKASDLNGVKELTEKLRERYL